MYKVIILAKGMITGSALLLVVVALNVNGSRVFLEVNIWLLSIHQLHWYLLTH